MQTVFVTNEIYHNRHNRKRYAPRRRRQRSMFSLLVSVVIGGMMGSALAYFILKNYCNIDLIKILFETGLV